MGGAEIVESISFDGIFNRPLNSEKVYDERGNALPDVSNIVNADGDSLATMGRVHRLLQPSAFLHMVEDSLEGLNYKLAFAASFANERSYVLGVEILGLSDFSIGNEAHKQFQVYGYAVDGSLAMFTSPVMRRLSCSNEFSMIVTKATGRCKNTANGQVKYDSLIHEIGELEMVQRGHVEACDRLANTAIGYDAARHFVAGLLASADASTLSTRSRNLVEDVMNRFQGGIETHGENRYDLFNAFTERYTHVAARKESARFGASILGKSAAIKRQALKALKGDGLFDSTVARGRQLWHAAK